MISIIIPVYNDTNNLLKLLRQLPKDIEIIVCATSEEFSEIKSKIPNYAKVKLITSEPGKASQMNAGANKAKNEILWFVHADSNLEHIDFEEIRDFLKTQSGNFLMSFRIDFDSHKFYYRIVEMTSFLRQKILMIPFGDQGMLMPKSLFDREGPFIPPFEDLRLSRRLWFRARHIVWWEPIITSPRRFEQHGKLFTHFIMFFIFWSALFGLESLAMRLYKFIK